MQMPNAPEIRPCGALEEFWDIRVPIYLQSLNALFSK